MVTQVVLVDEHDREVGASEKIDAHVPPGRLHRAFSVLLHDAEGRILLQQRADSKHHFRSIWANSCCGHPEPGEALVPAARQRVREELGVDVGNLDVVGAFRYRAEDDESGLVEHEIDHVLVGQVWTDLQPDPKEVKGVRWIHLDLLVEEMASRPHDFAPWLPGVIETASWLWDPATSYPDLGLALGRGGRDILGPFEPSHV